MSELGRMVAILDIEHEARGKVIEDVKTILKALPHESLGDAAARVMVELNQCAEYRQEIVDKSLNYLKKSKDPSADVHYFVACVAVEKLSAEAKQLKEGMEERDGILHYVAKLVGLGEGWTFDDIQAAVEKKFKPDAPYHCPRCGETAREVTEVRRVRGVPPIEDWRFYAGWHERTVHTVENFPEEVTSNRFCVIDGCALKAIGKRRVSQGVAYYCAQHLREDDIINTPSGPSRHG